MSHPLADDNHSEMVLRVAAAMAKVHGFPAADATYRIAAKAAIAAMREPTDEMAMTRADHANATYTWRRMIDEALR